MRKGKRFEYGTPKSANEIAMDHVYRATFMQRKVTEEGMDFIKGGKV